MIYQKKSSPTRKIITYAVFYCLSCLPFIVSPLTAAQAPDHDKAWNQCITRITKRFNTPSQIKEISKPLLAFLKKENYDLDRLSQELYDTTGSSKLQNYLKKIPLHKKDTILNVLQEEIARCYVSLKVKAACKNIHGNKDLTLVKGFCNQQEKYIPSIVHHIIYDYYVKGLAYIKTFKVDLRREFQK